MAGTGDVDAVIVADGFTDALSPSTVDGSATGGSSAQPTAFPSPTLTAPDGSATGGVTALPTNWPHIPVAPPIVEPTAGGDAEPAGPPAATVDPPAGAGSGGAVPLPVNLNPAAIVAPIGAGQGDVTTIPANWPHIPTAPPLVEPSAGATVEPVAPGNITTTTPTATGGGGAVIPTLPPPTIPIAPPIGGAGGGALPVDIILDPVGLVPPVGGGAGGVITSPLPMPVVPIGPPGGGGGGDVAPLPVPMDPVPVTPPAGGGAGEGRPVPLPIIDPVVEPPAGGGGGGAEIPPLPPPTIPIAPPIGGAGGGGVPIPVIWDPIIIGPILGPAIGGGGAFPVPIIPLPIFPPAGGGNGGVVVAPVGPPQVPVQPPAGGGGGGAIPVPGPFIPPAIQPPAGGGGGGGGAIPVGPPHIPIQPPIGGGGGGAIIAPIGVSPTPVSPPTGGAIGTDPTIIPLPIPTTPVSPPTGTGGGGATTSPVAPTGPGTTAPGGGAGGGGGATPTGPTQVPITAPTGTGTGTGTTSPTLPEIPVTAPTGGATGGNASTGVGEPFPTTTVSAPAATVSTDSTATGSNLTPTASQTVTAPTVSTTVSSGGTTTQTTACKCCGAASDPCCGPFSRTGPYFNRWFSGAEWSSSIVGRGKTTAPAKLVLSMIFGSKSSWGNAEAGDSNADLQQLFELEFDYYDPGESVTLPFPFRRFEVARWTNTGPVKCKLLGGDSWSDGATSDPYRGKAGNVWLNFESEYIYLLTGYRNTYQFTSPYQTDDQANCFVLLSSLENLNTDTFTYPFNGEAAKPSSYKVFFQRWDPKTASVYGYRYLMKTAQGGTGIFGTTVQQLTWVPSISGCSLRIQTQGNRSTATPGGNPIVFSVEDCAGNNCNQFGATLTVRRDQDCSCPNGYAKSLFGPDGLCPTIDLGFTKPELQVDLTAYTHVAPYSAANTSNPTIPMRLGYAGFSGYTGYCDGSLVSYNGLAQQQGSDITKKALVFNRFDQWLEYELQPSGDPIKMTIRNFNANNNLKYATGNTFYTWSSLSSWGPNYTQYAILRGPKTGSTIPDGVLQYVSHSCSPFSMTFAGSLWMSYGRYFNEYDTHIANVEITFSLPSNGLVTMAGPPAQMGNPTTPAQSLIQQSKTRLALPCIHRGQPLEESASCGCGGAVLTACSLYGKCRPYGTATDAQVCTRCPDYAAG